MEKVNAGTPMNKWHSPRPSLLPHPLTHKQTEEDFKRTFCAETLKKAASLSPAIVCLQSPLVHPPICA
jgi:hypothetical protein